MNETTTGLLLAGLMGMFGGLLTIPIIAALHYWLRRDELEYTRKLEMIAKQRELLLQHKLEMERRGKDKVVSQPPKEVAEARKKSRS